MIMAWEKNKDFVINNSATGGSSNIIVGAQEFSNRIVPEMKSARAKPFLLAILNGLTSLVLINGMMPSTNEKSWTYEIKSVESESSQPDLLNIDLHVDRVARGIYSIGGTFTVDFDIVEGDDTEVKADSYRSDNGVNEYKVLPFKMARQHFINCLNNFYKDMIMATLKDCSDLPVFKDKFQPPFERKTYTLHQCQFSQDGFPNHLQDGFYKIEILGFGKADWSLTVIVEVEKKV